MRLPEWLEETPLGENDLERDLLGMSMPAAWLSQMIWRSWLAAPRETILNNLCVAVEAPWGAGKTSFLALVRGALAQQLEAEALAQRRLEAEGPARPTAGEHPIWLDFNVWQSGSTESSVWAALAYRIGEALYRNVHERCLRACAAQEKFIEIGSPRRPGETTKLPVEKLKDERLHWLEVAVRLSEGVEEHWHPCLKLFADAPSKVPGRGIGWKAGLAEIGRGGLGAGAALLGAAGPGVDAVQKMAKNLVQVERREAAPNDTDTREFAENLGRLCAALHHRALRWRIGLVIDDVSRAEPDQISSLLDALSYVRELRGVLAFVCLDEAVIQVFEASAARRARPAGEGFMTKLVHLRYRLPRPDIPFLGRLAARFFSDIGVPTVWDATGVENPTRRLLEGGVLTPRQMKRALTWLWSRLSGDEAFLRACRSPRLGDDVVAALAFLVDLHLHAEGLMTAEEMAAAAIAHKDVLRMFSRQPWDGHAFRDPMGAGAAALESSIVRETVASVRYLSLIRYMGIAPGEGDVKLARGTWKKWCHHLSRKGSDVLGLSTVKSESLSDLMAALGSMLQPYSTLRQLCVISSAIRTLGTGILVDASPQTFGDMLDRWHDADALVRCMTATGSAGSVMNAAWLLLCRFHVDVLEEVDPHGRFRERVVEGLRLKPETLEWLLAEVAPETKEVGS